LVHIIFYIRVGKTEKASVYLFFIGKIQLSAAVGFTKT